MQLSRELKQQLVNVAVDTFRKRHPKRLSPPKTFLQYYGITAEEVEEDIKKKIQPLIDRYNEFFTAGESTEFTIDVNLSGDEGYTICRLPVQVRNCHGIFHRIYIKDIYPDVYKEYIIYKKKAAAIQTATIDRMYNISRDLNIAIAMTPTLREFHTAFPLWWDMLKQLKAAAND